jgi:hypothetical protein
MVHYTEITEIIACTGPISTSSSSAFHHTFIIPPNRLGILFSRILAVMTFVSDKGFGLGGTVQRELEGNKKGSGWEILSVVMVVMHLFPRPRIATEWCNILHSRRECRSRGW